MKVPLVFVGSGEFAREVAAMVMYTSLNEKYDILGFVSGEKPKEDARLPAEFLGDLEFLSDLRKSYPNLAVSICIGNPSVRAKVYQKMEHFDLNYPNLIHPLSEIGWNHRPDLIIGKGNIISQGCIFTTDIRLGDFNILNLGCLVGHDVWISNFCTVMHGAKFSGGATVGDKVLVGTGSAFIRKCDVPSGVIVPSYSVVRGTFIP